MNYNTNTTYTKASDMAGSSGDISSEIRAFYDKNIIKEAKANLVHDQFAQKRPVPQNGGRRIEFTKLAPLSKAMKPLTEGVTPDGNKLTWSKIVSELNQYGDYVTLSDMIVTTDVDNNLVEAGIILGNQAGETLDSVTREVIVGGTNVSYASNVAARYLLEGASSTAANNHYLKVEDIKNAVRTLKRNKAKKINGSYIAIIHPDVAYDLMEDPKWEAVKTYADPKDWYEGEVGRMYGVRFVETTEAKIFSAPDLVSTSRNLTVVSSSGKNVVVSESFTADAAVKLNGRKIIIGNNIYKVSAAVSGSKTITFEETVTASAGDILYPGEAGKNGGSVYATLIIGADAYGVSELEGGGLMNIIKQLGSGGSADPLNQRATTGWKGVKTAEILVDEYVVRIESACSF